MIDFEKTFSWYFTGRFQKNLHIIFDDYALQWNIFVENDFLRIVSKFSF